MMATTRSKAAQQPITGYEVVQLQSGQGVSPITAAAWGLVDSWGPTTARGIAVEQVLAVADETTARRYANPQLPVLAGEHSVRNELADWLGWHTPDELVGTYLLLGDEDKARFVAMHAAVLGQDATASFMGQTPNWLRDKLARAEARNRELQRDRDCERGLGNGWRQDAASLRKALDEATAARDQALAAADRLRDQRGDAERDLAGAQERLHTLSAALRAIARQVQAGDLEGARDTLLVADGLCTAQRVRDEQEGR